MDLNALREFGIALVLLVVCTAAGLTQSTSDNSLASGAALQVTAPGREPSVVPFHKGTSGIWFGSIKKIPEFASPPDELPIRAVNFTAVIDGSEAARVRVSLYRGVKGHESEDDLITLRIEHGVDTEVTALRRVGVEPFRIKLIRTLAGIAPVPLSVNRTQTLQVSIEPAYETTPTAKARIFNYSDKAVAMIGFLTRVGNRTLISGMPHDNKQALPLIQPNGHYDLKFSVERPASFPQSEEIEFVLGTVVFEDGSFEGDEKAASTFRAFALGSRSRLRQIIPIFKKALESDRTDVEIDQLITEIERTNEKLDESELARLKGDFPGQELSATRRSAEISSIGVKRDFVTALRDLQKSGKTSIAAKDVAILVMAYEGWLGRLEKY